jgi:hypothetical protein
VIQLLATQTALCMAKLFHKILPTNTGKVLREEIMFLDRFVHLAKLAKALQALLAELVRLAVLWPL